MRHGLRNLDGANILPEGPMFPWCRRIIAHFCHGVAWTGTIVSALGIVGCKGKGAVVAPKTRDTPVANAPNTAGEQRCGDADETVDHRLNCNGPLRPAPLAPAYVAPLGRDLVQDRTLYVVNYSHLDTQWRWSFPQTIRQYLPYTIEANRLNFQRFPDQVFNWTGASRYQLLKEYYPDAFRDVKDWVAQGRWFAAGNQWEECDVLVPSSESLIRQILQGNEFFRREFGTESQEFMLPDSFGFPASLPSILAHAGLRGFSTQKLTWNSAVGIPFDIGQWRGSDGRSVIAALNAGSYGAIHREDPSTSESFIEQLDKNGKNGGLKIGYVYNGRGDRGGAPHEISMKTMAAAMKSSGPVKVVVGPADLMFRDISDAEEAILPAYSGDLLLTEHSAGSLTSQAFMKRLNRMNELLANAAEGAATAAHSLDLSPYPAARLQQAWRLMLRGQFHDILPGTSIPAAYGYSWNDEFVAMNLFLHVLSDAVASVSRVLDTRLEGLPVVLFNPLSIPRSDLVDAALPQELVRANSVVAIDDEGRVLPTQLTMGVDGVRHALFMAHLSGNGFSVYGLRAGTAPAMDSKLSIGNRGLANGRYRVTLSDSGDVSSIQDLVAKRELLSQPMRLAFLSEWPSEFPAWNMDWVDRKQPPRGYVEGEAKFRVVETGPLRVSLEIERESAGSRFIQTIRLSTDESADRVEFIDHVDWKTTASSLKATFPLTVGNPKATYSWDLGTVERGNNHSKQYEVPTHSWFDLTDRSGEYGVTILTGAKYGSDKPADDTVRLTQLFTPEATEAFREQRYQDWGRHDIHYGLVGHAGDWRRGKAHWQAKRLEQPILAFAATKHAGSLGKSFSLLQSSNDQVAIQAIKFAEDGQQVVVRLQELHGQEARTRIRSPNLVTAAWELNGVEKTIAPLAPEHGTVRLDFQPNQLRTVGLSLTPPPTQTEPRSLPVDLDYDIDAMSFNAHRSDGDCDGEGKTYPAEMLPDMLPLGNVTFRLGPRGDGMNNALSARGQTIALPTGYLRIHLLLASIGGGTQAVFRIGDEHAPIDVANWSGFVGQWDQRVFEGEVPDVSFSIDNDLLRIDPAYLRRDRIAWQASHLHRGLDGDLPYVNAYLFAYSVPAANGTTTLTLPNEPNLRIFAITVSDEDEVIPLSPLWPDLARDAAFRRRFARLVKVGASEPFMQ